MEGDRADLHAQRLIQLSEEVSRIAGALAQISIGFSAPQPRQPSAHNLNEPEVAPEIVKWLIQARRHRTRYLSPDLFAEPAWDILLDLFHAYLAGHRISVSSACIGSGVPLTTGLRWLQTLERQGLVVRKFDPKDARRIFVELSPQASSALRLYFHEVVEPAHSDQR